MKGAKPQLLVGRPEHISRFPAVVLAVMFIVLSLFWAELSFVAHYTPVCVDGDSMLTTLEDGDWLYADVDLQPKRHDIIIIDVKDYRDSQDKPLFWNKDGTIEFIIKRLIAVEGDELYGDEEGVWLRSAGEREFHLLDEPYKTVTSPRASEFDLVKVGKGEIFVMGDNRDISKDSTEVGVLKAEDILGVVPDWAVKNKGAITWWERFRGNVRTFFENLFS